LFHKPNHGFQRTIVTTVELFWGDNQKKKDSDYVYEAYSKAIYFLDKEEYEKSLPYFEVAVKTDELLLKAWAHFRIGFCYEKLGNYKDAIEPLKQAIRLDPDDAIDHCALGFAYSRIGDINSALNEYKILKELDIDLANKLFDFIY